MPDADPALAGVQSCGCITFVTTRPDDLDREDQKALTKIITSGGTVERRTVGEIKADPNFFPRECPHDPKGWEHEKPKPFEPTARCAKTYRGSVKRVSVRVTEGSKHTFPAGDLVKHEGKWYATEGWFDPAAVTAHSGDETAEVAGPYDTRREAIDWLIAAAVARYAELTAKWDRERRAKAA